MDLQVFKIFAEALAIGLLIGSERYKWKGDQESQTAGVRTFSIISLSGACAALLNVNAFTLLSFAALAVFLGLGYYRNPKEAYGLTTELAALLTFWLGYLLRDYEALAISTGIVLVILLASKKTLHDFVKKQVSETEFFDTLKFLAVVFVVFPLLPNRYVGPFDFLNPTQIWLLIILVSTISYAGYVLIRVFGGRKGLAITSILGGIVSTTAVTLSLAGRVKEVPSLARVCGINGVMANAVQFPRLLLLIWVVDAGLGARLAPPFLAMAAAGFGSAVLLGRLKSGAKMPPIAPLLSNPFSLGPVLKFGVFLVGVFLLVKMAGIFLGDQGVYLASALAGAGSVSAIALSLADMVEGGSLSIETAAIAILLALCSNAVLKWSLAFFHGTRQLAVWLGAGFLVMLGLGAVLITTQIYG